MVGGKPPRYSSSETTGVGLGEGEGSVKCLFFGEVQTDLRSKSDLLIYFLEYGYPGTPTKR